MRLFIAAPIPAIVLSALENQQTLYNQEGMRLVPSENLHLTLHFLGETPPAKVPDLTQKLQAVASELSAFTLIFEETAPGPKLKAPRLVWTRFKQHPEFTRLASAIQNTLDSPSDHPGEYIPHITIARLKKDKPGNLSLPVVQANDFPPYPVNSFSIWQSQLGSPHPRYGILQDFQLQPATV